MAGDPRTTRERKLESALISIAANTCCEGCQEAARVARAALADSDQPEDGWKLRQERLGIQFYADPAYQEARRRRPLEAAAIDSMTDEQRFALLRAMERGFAKGRKAAPWWVRAWMILRHG